MARSSALPRAPSLSLSQPLERSDIRSTPVEKKDRGVGKPRTSKQSYLMTERNPSVSFLVYRAEGTSVQTVSSVTNVIVRHGRRNRPGGGGDGSAIFWRRFSNILAYHSGRGKWGKTDQRGKTECLISRLPC